MRDADLPCDCVYRGDRTYKSGYEIGTHIAALPREQLYTAIYCVNGSMAAGLQDAFRQAGILRHQLDLQRYGQRDSSGIPAPDKRGSGTAGNGFCRCGTFCLSGSAIPNSLRIRILYSPALQECGSVKQLIE